MRRRGPRASFQALQCRGSSAVWHLFLHSGLKNGRQFKELAKGFEANLWTLERGKRMSQECAAGLPCFIKPHYAPNHGDWATLLCSKIKPAAMRGFYSA
ncbi:hypothetical protein GOM96_15165 [Stutzerimonas degradans]|nr:hypothetical protein GOM96_15165 [Stutzerimonas degradans]